MLLIRVLSNTVDVPELACMSESEPLPSDNLQASVFRAGEWHPRASILLQLPLLDVSHVRFAMVGNIDMASQPRGVSVLHSTHEVV
jgi:hypothetical protein